MILPERSVVKLVSKESPSEFASTFAPSLIVLLIAAKGRALTSRGSADARSNVSVMNSEVAGPPEPGCLREIGPCVCVDHIGISRNPAEEEDGTA
jgi:hypothetical protein